MAQQDGAAPAAITLVVSSDPVLSQRATEEVVEGIRSTEADVAVSSYVGSELEHFPELRTVSLFGGSTAAVVLQAETMSAALVDEAVTYVEQPDATARLVLVMAKVGRAKRLTDAVRARARKDKAIARVVTAEPPPEWREQDWRRIVRDEFVRHRRRVEERAIDLVLERAGLDVSVIASKVRQVVEATDGDRSISTDDVDDVLAGVGRRSGFAVADAVVARDPRRALTLLRGSLEAGDEPVMLLGGLASKVRQLMGVHSGMSADELGMQPYPFKLARDALRGFDPGELGAAHRLLATTDVDLKGSDLPADVVIELAVMQIATRGGLTGGSR